MSVSTAATLFETNIIILRSLYHAKAPPLYKHTARNS